jgi:tetratricopeptide (TPR) repeat protein
MKMIMKMKMFSVLLMATVFSGNVALAQCKEGWPQDKAKAEEALAIYGDAIKAGKYRDAVPSLRWLLNNAPKLSTKIYIDGAEIYDKLADKETDPAKKQVLIDSMLTMYDLRIKNCGDEINVLNRKAYASYKFNVQNKDKVADLLTLYDQVYEKSGNNVSDNNLVAYMTVVKANVILLKTLTEDQILQRHDKIQSIADVKIKAYQEKQKLPDVEKIKNSKNQVGEILIGLVKVDCEFVKKNLEPKFRQNPNDLAIAKKISGYMLQGKCIDDPLWLEASEVVHKLSPDKDYGLAKVLGLTYLNNNNTQRAEELLKEAQGLAKTQQDKAEALIALGSLESKKGNKTAARDYYRQAASADPNNKDAFERIGDLYYGSFPECSKKKSMAEDRLVYIAAYDKFAQAGNSQKMAAAKAQFPSVTELFELNWKEGESKPTGCWIGENVILKTRGKD